MQDKMIPIKGYFKIEKIKDQKVIDTYEDKNTIMARIPELFAGMSSGYFQANLDKYTIGCIALGTGGSTIDTLGNEVPKAVRDNRQMLFSEYDFWNTPNQISQGQTPILDKNKYVYQLSFYNEPRGDLNQNISTSADLLLSNEGSTYPHTDWVPDTYRSTPYSYVTDNQHGLTGNMNLRQNAITYTFTLGQFTGNNSDNTAKAYTEAGLYFNLGKDADIIGKPLGTLFSMKTFPSQFKTSDCALRITWRLFF